MREASVSVWRGGAGWRRVCVGGLLAMALWLVLMPRTLGQTEALVLGPAASSVRAEGAGVLHGGHGWAVVPEPRGGGHLLVHLPPREFVCHGALVGSKPGTVRVALRLEEAPEAMAAVGETVYLVFRSRLTAGGSVRQVSSVTALHTGLRDLWDYGPGGRLGAEASLPGEGRLVGFAGTSAGPAALIDRGPVESMAGVEGAAVEGVRVAPRPPPDLGLWVLRGGGWRGVELPELGGVEGEAPALRRFMLASSEGGLVLVGTRPARHATVWRAGLTIEAVMGPELERRRLERERRAAERAAGGRSMRDEGGADAPEAELVELEWLASPLALPGGEGRSTVLPTGPLMEVGGRVVFAHVEGGGGLTMYSVGTGAVERLAGIEGRAVEKPAAVAGVVSWIGSRRLGVVLSGRGEEGDRGASIMDTPMSLRVVEVSTDTGARVYDGPSTTGSGLSKEGVQAILLVVLGVTTLLLVWTIRAGGGSDVVTLPEGAALAEPGRRLVAGIVDYVVACVVAGWILGEPLLDVLSLSAVLGSESSLTALGVLVGVGAGVSGVMEGVLGGSAGKLMMGMRVVVVRGGRGGSWRGPGLVRGLGRNVVRWVVWPVVLFGLGRPDGRHVGDRMMGTAVVVRVEGGGAE